MAYQALYRKWRPLKFDDVIGQEHIVGTIRNEILSGRIAHAYLFTGTRGTGKTTTAKILSRAVNCLSPINANPCNECDSCKAILSDISLDVQEIDAATNTGIDNIRDIIDQLSYSPSMGKYKVYIIDEVHMLSTGAFNALLKTLEEPPPHVIFILATTEVNKVPATILSRCQRFDFKTISISDIVLNIKKILGGEGISADDDALEYVAFLGDGSMRDSLSILDQCLAFKENNLTLSDVTSVVGAVDDSMLYEFATDIASGDVTRALARFNTCINEGKNCDNIAKGLLSTFREIMMYKINKDSFSVSSLKKKYISECSDKFDIASLISYINIMSDCISSFKTFSSQRVLVECALVRLSTPQMNDGADNLAIRLTSVENRISAIEKNGIKPQINDGKEKTPMENSQKEVGLENFDFSQETEENSEELTEKEKKKEEVKSEQEPLDSAELAAEKWNEVLSFLKSEKKIMLFTYLSEIRPYAQNGRLVLSTDDDFRLSQIKSAESVKEIENAIVSSLSVNVQVVVEKGDNPYLQKEDNDLFNNLNSLGKQFPDNFNLG